jgi:hypothetical protein
MSIPSNISSAHFVKAALQKIGLRGMLLWIENEIVSFKYRRE